MITIKARKEFFAVCFIAWVENMNPKLDLNLSMSMSSVQQSHGFIVKNVLELSRLKARVCSDHSH